MVTREGERKGDEEEENQHLAWDKDAGYPLTLGD